MISFIINNWLTILLVWVIISVPVTLLVGRMIRFGGSTPDLDDVECESITTKSQPDTEKIQAIN